MMIEYEVDSYIQTTMNGRKRIHTILYSITKKKIKEFFNEIEVEEDG